MNYLNLGRKVLAKGYYCQKINNYTSLPNISEHLNQILKTLIILILHYGKACYNNVIT